MAAESKPALCAAVKKDTTAAGEAPAVAKLIARGMAPQEQSGVAKPSREDQKHSVNRCHNEGVEVGRERSFWRVAVGNLICCSSTVETKPTNNQGADSEAFSRNCQRRLRLVECVVVLQQEGDMLCS